MALTSGNTVATLRPVDALQPNTVYTLTITQSVKDPFGRPLPSAFVTAFTSLDTVAPPPPPAGSIAATIPGGDFKTTITATQGTAGAHDTVVIRNLTQGTITPVILDPNGGFVVIVTASIADKLQLIVTDAAGNQTVVSIPRFQRQNADGSLSTAVGSDGGRVLGPGCTTLGDGSLSGSTCVALDVPDGAFPSGTIITVKPVAEADFPVQLTAEQKQVFSYAGGLQLDLGGQTPASYINVSIPAHASDTLVDRWVVGQVLTLAGVPPALNVADTARLINGRIATSSPPCPGVTGSGVYGFLKSARPMGVTFTAISSGSGFLDALQMLADDFSQASADASMGLPFGVALDEQVQAVLGLIPRRVCLPVLSGRVTVAPNRVTVPIPPALVTADDDEVVVTNNATGRQSTSTFYPPFEGSASIEGSDADPIAIEVHSRAVISGVLTATTRTLGSAECVAHSLPADCTKPAPRSFVVIEIPKTELLSGDQSLVVQNTRTKTRATVAFAGGRQFSNVRMIVEGTVADTYTAQAVGVAGQRPVVPLNPVAYLSGTGSLLVRAIPGAIDPTRAEIIEYNLNRPSGQPALDENAGVKLVKLLTKRPGTGGALTVVRTDVILDATAGNTGRVVTGGFVFALDANITDTFVVQVEYENGTIDEQALPNFRVTVKNTSTQAIRRQLVGPAPYPDDTLLLDVYGPDSVVPDLLTDVNRFIDFDPARSIVLAFSAPILNTTLLRFAVYDATTGQRIAGQVHLSERDKVLTFVPDKPLALDGVYQLNLVGLTDLLGRPLAVRSIPLTTFTPRKLSTFQMFDVRRGIPCPSATWRFPVRSDPHRKPF